MDYPGSSNSSFRYFPLLLYRVKVERASRPLRIISSVVHVISCASMGYYHALKIKLFSIAPLRNLTRYCWTKSTYRWAVSSGYDNIKNSHLCIEIYLVVFILACGSRELVTAFWCPVHGHEVLFFSFQVKNMYVCIYVFGFLFIFCLYIS